MSVVAVALLVVASVTMLLRPGGVPVWFGPVGAAVVGLVVTAIPTSSAIEALDVLRDPVLFLACAVPLALALDDLGVFESIAAMVDGGRHLVAWLWLIAAGVTILCNLDAAVVLLTPLYARIARRNSLPLEAVVFQPALLACLASHPLPVSNLTNLIVAEQFDLGAVDFLRNLLPATIAAVAVGWLASRRVMPAPLPTPSLDVSPDRGSLVRGVPVLLFVLLGFTVGDELGVPAWLVAATALAGSVALGARPPSWRRLPWEAVAVALGLGVVVAGAVPHLGLDRLLGGEGAWGRLQALLVGGLGAGFTNNLPAVLATAPSLQRTDQVWPLLFGVNAAPVLVLTGALSSLLWRETATAAGLEVSSVRFSSVGIRVGGPALAAGALLVVFAP